MSLYSRLAGCLFIISCLFLAACQAQSAARPESVSPSSSADQPVSGVSAPGLATAYPAGSDGLAADQTNAAQGTEQNQNQPPIEKNIAGPGAPGVIDNQSQVTARLISLSLDETMPDLVRLHVTILSSEKVFGPTDFTWKFIDKEADLIALKEDLPELKSGDRFSAKVWFNPKDQGREYRATEVKKLD